MAFQLCISLTLLRCYGAPLEYIYLWILLGSGQIEVILFIHSVCIMVPCFKQHKSMPCLLVGQAFHGAFQTIYVSELVLNAHICLLLQCKNTYLFFFPMARVFCSTNVHCILINCNIIVILLFTPDTLVWEI